MKKVLILAVLCGLLIGCDNSAKQAELRRSEERLFREAQEQVRAAQKKREEEEKRELAMRKRQEELNRIQLEEIRQKRAMQQLDADLDKVRRDSDARFRNILGK